MVNLQKYGWDSQWEKLKNQSTFANLEHGRVVNTHKTRYDVMTADGILDCEVTGNLLYNRESDELPTTGDWVVFQRFDELGIIIEVLQRKNALTRKRSGTRSEIQNFAANIDKALIVQSLDENFNVRRLERFLVQVTDSGIDPIVVFTKTDLGYNSEEVTTLLANLVQKVPIFYTSIFDSESIEVLRNIITGNQTFILIGSSGVGKSSLINALCGNNGLDTSAISTHTGKGRHTSTRREIVLLEGGGVFLDTPGVRELGLTGISKDSIAEIFDIDTLSSECRFSDCTHTDEPGCAVLAMIDSGQLEKSVHNSYLKLVREARHFSETVYEKRRSEKQFTRMVKHVVKLKKNR